MKPGKIRVSLELERAGKDTFDVEDGDELREVNIIQMLNSVESEYTRKQYGNMTNIHVGRDVNGSIFIGDHNTANG